MEENVQHRLLIVDDDEIHLKLLTHLLTGKGYQCYPFSKPFQVFENIAQVEPDLIILDYLMPKMNGVELCRKIKGNAVFADIPIIFITSNNDTESLVETFNAGAVDYISKPINHYELFSRIKTHIDLAVAKRELSRRAVNFERIADEKNQLLIHADRLATLGTLSAGVAHEINNPSTFISSNVQTIEKFWPVIENVLREKLTLMNDFKIEFILDEMPEILRGIKTGVERITKIVTSLKQFSRKRVVSSTLINLDELINNAVFFCTNALKKNKIDLVMEMPEEKTAIKGDQQQLEQVLINLLMNANDVLNEKSITNPEIKILVYVSDEEVLIEVSDNGPGIRETELDKIWEPFYTTKEVGKGTGLGLSISLSIIENHGGAVRVQNLPQGGAKFSIYLPINS